MHVCQSDLWGITFTLLAGSQSGTRQHAIATIVEFTSDSLRTRDSHGGEKKARQFDVESAIRRPEGQPGHQHHAGLYATLVEF